MGNNGLISVIIPVYNVEKYLRECIDSVLNQTYGSYEIILVDDGSTDSSGKICDEYSARYHKITVIHKENSGPSATRNVGLSVANGEYIYFLDSDDYIVPRTFEKLVEIATTENADVVFFDGISFVDGNPESKIKQGYKRYRKYTADTGLGMLEKLNNNKDFKCALYLMLIKRRLITDNSLSFFEDAYCSEDMLFTYQLYCLADKVAQCTDAFYYRRFRDNSIVTSHKTKRHFLSCKCVFEQVKAFSCSQNLTDNTTAQAFIIRCAYNALDNYNRISAIEKKECKATYSTLKKQIIADNAYGDKGLKLRCYGKVFWFIYKVFEKTVGRLLV